jgi:hypothetical protein
MINIKFAFFDEPKKDGKEFFFILKPKLQMAQNSNGLI